MNILAIDTTMAACSAAVLRSRSGDLLARRFEAMERGHAEALFPMISAVMDEAGLSFAELDRIAVTLGPGTFTGVRAGLAAARGLALAANLPVAGAGSLAVMAMGCITETDEPERSEGFMVAHDARRGELYCQFFDRRGQALCEAEIMTAGEAAEKLPVAMSLIAGSGAAAIAVEGERIGRRLAAKLPGLLPDAGQLARLALHLPPSERPPVPLYLRAPDAKPQMNKSFARAQS
jgi:tRNA threonylcarbamoyladenosine biosynthesis protein TsaB